MTVGDDDLTTLANVKQYLRIAQANDDALLQTLITNVSDYIQVYLNRKFNSQDYTGIANGSGFGCQQLAFGNYPVSAVSTLTICGNAIPQVAITDGRTRGYRFSEDYIYLNGYEFVNGIANVQCTYTAGFDTLPPSIVQACNELVGLRYREIERIGQSSKVLNGENVNYITDAMQKSVSILLSNWKKVIPILAI